MSDASETTNVIPPTKVAEAAEPARGGDELAHERINHLSHRVGIVERMLQRAHELIAELRKTVVAKVDHAAEAVAGAAGAVAAVAPPPVAQVAGAVEKIAGAVADLIPCPEHPDAPQTPNGCTAAGCTFSPPAR